MKAIQNSNLLDIKATLEEDVGWNDLKVFVLGQLEVHLPRDLFYHGIHHTRDDVLPAAVRLAAMAQLERAPRLILLTATLLHDVGFTIDYQNHEENAVTFVQDLLPRFGYSESQILEIIRVILGTKMPQRPGDFLEALLCDADLDSLGRKDYLATSVNLWAEMAVHGQPLPLEVWYQRQLGFLSSHSYFTQEATVLRQAGKQENIRLLERLSRQVSR